MYNEITSNKRKTAVLMVLFVLIISALGIAASYAFELGYAFMGFIALLSVGSALFSYYKGDRVALSVAGAKEIQQADNPYVFRMVENLCITAGIPMPKVHIIPDSALNAFATGRDPEHASIAITTGLINALENEELEGVIAHELSHVKNYDIRLMTVVIICVGFIALMADIGLRRAFWGGMGGNRDRNNAPLIIIGLILAALSPIIAQLIQFAISRKREFLADASGSLLTRYPEGLARALEKISHSEPLARANRATAHLYIANPFKRDTMKKAANLFSTHPPIQERIKRLRTFA